jgi:hypothetical protein
VYHPLIVPMADQEAKSAARTLAPEVRRVVASALPSDQGHLRGKTDGRGGPAE